MPVPELSTYLRDTFIDVKKGVMCMTSQDTNDLGLYVVDLFEKIGLACYDFVALGVSITWWSALQDVTNKDIPSGKTGPRDQLVEQTPGPAHKGSSLQILFFSRCLANKNEIRPFIAFTENDRSARSAQITLYAVRHCFSECSQRLRPLLRTAKNMIDAHIFKCFEKAMGIRIVTHDF